MNVMCYVHMPELMEEYEEIKEGIDETEEETEYAEREPAVA